MTNLDKFALAVDWYIQNLDKCSKEERDEKYLKFQARIQDLECNDFRYYFYRADYLNRHNQMIEAKYNIEKSIHLVENIDDNSIFATNGNGIYLFVPIPNSSTKRLLNLPHINNQKLDVYSCAGEIYAKINKEKKSLECYKIAMYYVSLLKSEFEKQKEIFVFSFRRFNEYTLSDLINHEITVSPSSKMNDPFDSVINLWGTEKRLVDKCTEIKHLKPLCESFNSYRIRCFCIGNGNLPTKNILMWSHYAGEHTGFCIKYKLSQHFIDQEANDKYEHMYLKKIIYTNKKINILSNSINSDLAFATKKKDWKYENEVRLIVYNPNKSESFYGIKLDNLSKIDTIFFGYRCPDSTITTIKNLFIDKHTESPKFYKMILDPKNVYNLKYIKI